MAGNLIGRVWLRFAWVILALLSLTMMGVVLVCVLPLVVPYLEGAESYRGISWALSVEPWITGLVKNIIPTTVSGTDMSRWITIAVAFVLGAWLSGACGSIQDRLRQGRMESELAQVQSRLRLTENAPALAPLHKKIEEMKTARSKDREELLREFAEAKRQLDQMGRDLTFLAIDVIDSTGMKQGEEKGVVEHDFREYKRLVERAFAAFGCLKSAWTPDGVMACFTSVDAAVQAGSQVIEGLEHFNRSVKVMKRDFAVRCGVNSGFVYFDDSVPMEEMSDRVIDIAGHLQKQAPMNTVCVAKPAIEPLNDRMGFRASGQIVDGYEVYVWGKPPVDRQT